MTKRVKPSYSVVWAELGDNSKPLDSYIQNGWEAVKPPRQYFNWLDNRQDSALAYLYQAGIPEWDNATPYEGNFSYVQGSDSKVYKCIANNTNTDPTNPANAAFWEEAFASKAAYDALAADVTALETQMGDGSGVTNPVAWRSALGVSPTSDTVIDADFTGANQSLGTSGYQKLPGGLIMQWGRWSATDADSSTTITFPIAFPTGVLNLSGGVEYQTAPSDNGVVIQFYNPTTTTVVIRRQDIATATGEDFYMNWFAIGH